MEPSPERPSYDVIVIGGGINGSGIALDLARAGYSVLLLERQDFGSGTTSRSTKLVHGGLRYLEHGEFALVFESLREREALLHLAPHLVRPLTFVLPVRRGDRRSPFVIRLGLWLYDLLSFRKSLRRHHGLSRDTLARLEPYLSREDLAAAFTYQDAQVVYPERLTIENVLAARRAGAHVRNYAEVVGLLRRGDTVHGVRFYDRVEDTAREAEARLVINAAGPWVDGVLRMGVPEASRRIGGTKGSHLVIDFHGRGPRHAVYAQARTDGRPFFIIPWEGCHLVGTTDIRFEGDPADVRATPDEVAYLLEETNLLFPDAALSPDDVLYTYSGVRPLPYTERGPEAAITRRHLIYDHEKADGVRGIISVIGGKLTTYRSLSSQVLRAVRRRLGDGRAAGQGRGPLPDLADLPPAEAIPELALHHGVTPESMRRLVDLYGGRYHLPLDAAADRPELREPFCPDNPDLAAELVYAVEQEEARTLADVLLRRTGIGWRPCRGLDCAETAAAVLGRHAGWNAARQVLEVRQYRDEVKRALPRPGEAPTERHES
jgi:glycerol-3-phosphate dehydrogenase